MKSRLSKLLLALRPSPGTLVGVLSVMKALVQVVDHCIDAGGSRGCFTTIQAAVNAPEVI